jgi:putative CocE/NonD family hydrolase
MPTSPDGQADFFPPTALEKSARATGADAVRYRVDYLMLPMRDGVRLATVVMRPRAAGRYPTVMSRTPYAMTSFERQEGLYKPLFEADYVFILQNERGTEWSEGEFGYLTSTTADAMDTLDWIAAQDWSNGRVGLHGCSSTAENQLKLAATGHPALHACIPMSSGAGIGSVPGAEWNQGLFYRGGVPMLKCWALWHAPFGIRMRPKLPLVDDDEISRTFRKFSVSVPDFRVPEYASALAKSTKQAPSLEVLRRMGAPLTGFEIYMAEGPAGESWKQVDLIDATHTGATPSININGWMDIGAYETVKLFEFQQHHPDQYLIMAGTEHCRMASNAAPDAKLGDRPIGDTRFAYDEMFVAWFKRWLGDDADAWKSMPKVRVFLMGAGTWLNGESWPLPETRERSLFLASGGDANTLWGDGSLEDSAGADSADLVIADPHNPVPSLGDDLGADGPVCTDQREIECRADVLIYSTAALTSPVTIAGDVAAELYVSADVPDADVFVKLVDVYPDGTAYNLAQSCLRLRYRDGIEEPASLQPGEIYRIEIRGITTANYFPAGHKIRIEIAGSSFPLADRNWHTGGQNELMTDGRIAHLTLHHGEARPSRLRITEYTGPVDPKPIA